MRSGLSIDLCPGTVCSPRKLHFGSTRFCIDKPKPGVVRTCFLLLCLDDYCFSGENLVTVLGKGNVRLDSVEIGDYVRSSGGGDVYSRVYGFGHRQSQLYTEYLKFTFSKEGSLALEVSPKHLLFSNGKTIAAGQVKVGDFLDGENGEALLVAGTETVIRHGVYAPATESGEIVVSGVRASNYANMFHTSAFDQHTIAHAFTVPWRFVCKVYFEWCKQETYTKEGYSHYVKVFVWIAKTVNLAGSGVTYLTTVLLSPVIALLMVYDHSSSFWSLVACGFLGAVAYFGVHVKVYYYKQGCDCKVGS